jgi:chromosome partitioning protein
MVDLDPQRSLAAWWNRRGRNDNPRIFTGAETATDAVEALELDGWDWVFIDTPPAFVATIQDAIERADLAVVPLRASALDLIASEDAVVMAREAGTPHLCVINDAEPRWKTTLTARLSAGRSGSRCQDNRHPPGRLSGRSDVWQDRT